MSSPVHILLVDDQTSNLQALEAILASPDHALIFAKSADEALLALLQYDFAAIVLDIRMPEVSGIELAELIKQRKRSRDIPIVFLTAHLSDEKEVLKGYGAGGVDYLSKPINPDILRSKIAVFVDLFRKTRALAAANQSLEMEVAQRQQAEEALRKANEELEGRVEERTKALQQAKAEAEAANSAKDHFLAVLSHELRTPLTPVLLTVQLLERNPTLDFRMRDAIATIRRNVEMEARLIDDLLDLTRLARGKLMLDLQKVDVCLILQQAMQTCSADAADKGLRVLLELGVRDAFISADPTRLQQVFWNLLKNAIKFTPNGGEIRVKAHGELIDEREHVVVSVTDTGIGIEPTAIGSVFDAFSQGGEDVTRRFGGLGLGLAITKTLVQMQSGQIEAKSDGLNRGATFTVRLPKVSASAKVTSGGLTPETASVVPASAEACSLRILLVEDHKDSAELMTMILQQDGHVVQHAADVQSALSAVEESIFDLIISDLGLPDGSGHDLMQQVMRTHPTPGIALSGYGMEQDLAKSHAAGFIEHLIKPVNFRQLRAVLQRVGRRTPANA